VDLVSKHIQQHLGTGEEEERQGTRGEGQSLCLCAAVNLGAHKLQQQLATTITAPLQGHHTQSALELPSCHAPPAQTAQLCQPAHTSLSLSVRRWRLKKEVEELSSWRSWSQLVRLPLWIM
jgi:hypothetical protein